METGLDVDGRRMMLQDILPVYEKNLQKHIAFFRSIPLFEQFNDKDQMTLIQGYYCLKLHRFLVLN